MKVNASRRTTLLSVLSYPMLLTLLLLLLLLAQAWFISPVFEEMFRDFGLRLPAPTRIVFWVNRTLRDYFLLLIPMVLVGAVLVILLRWALAQGLEAFQYLASVRFLSMGSIANLIAMHRFIGTLATAMEIGIPSNEAIALAGNACQRTYYRNLARQFQTTQYHQSRSCPWDGFPPMFKQIMQSNLDEHSKVRALNHLAEAYRDRVLLRRQKSSIAIHPFAVLAVGVLIGIVSLSMFLPLVSLVTALA